MVHLEVLVGICLIEWLVIINQNLNIGTGNVNSKLKRKQCILVYSKGTIFVTLLDIIRIDLPP